MCSVRQRKQFKIILRLQHEQLERKVALFSDGKDKTLGKWSEKECILDTSSLNCHLYVKVEMSYRQLDMNLHFKLEIKNWYLKS